MTQQRLDDLNIRYMKTAILFSECSYAERKKVGAVIVNPQDGNIIAMGWNGQPSNWPTNKCEDENGNTTPSTIHSELNAILKAAKSGAKLEGCTLYVTMSTCSNCALLVIQSGISKVFYLEEYRDITGIEILKQAGIEVKKLII